MEDFVYNIQIIVIIYVQILKKEKGNWKKV